MKTEKKVGAEKTPKASKASKDSKGSKVISTNKTNPVPGSFDHGDGSSSTKVGAEDYPTGHADLGMITDHSKSLSMETSMLRELTKGLLATLISTQKK